MAVEIQEYLAAPVASEIVTLLDRGADTWAHKPMSEAARLQLTRVGSGFVALLHRDADGRVDGYGHLGRVGGRWTLEVVVDPAGGAPLAAPFSDLVDAAVDEVGRRGGGTVDLWVPQASEAADALVEAHGFAPVRDLLQMRRPLPLDLPEPATPVRPFVPGRDEERWLTLNARAFAHHAEQGTWTRADLERREAEPWFDPAGFLLAEDEGRLVAACWTKIHPPTDAGDVPGEIYVIGVDPDAQGRGLGRDLTVAGLHSLAERGATVAMLYVDADNAAALALYEALGFHLHHVDRAYRRVVGPQR